MSRSTTSNRKRLILFAAAALFSQPACAQAGAKRENAQRRLIAAVAECIVTGREAFFRRVVRLGSEIALFPRPEDGARAGDCYAKVSGDLSGGGIGAALGWLAPIAAQLVRIDYSDDTSFDFAPVPALQYVLLNDKDAKSAKPTRKQIARLDVRQRKLTALAFGECVARLEPLAVHRMLLTPIASEAENRAILALGVASKTCAANADFAIAPEEFREALALSFYRLASAAVVAIGRSSFAKYGRHA